MAVCKFVIIILKDLNGFLMTQRHVTLKDVFMYNITKLHRPRKLDAFLAVNMIF